MRPKIPAGIKKCVEWGFRYGESEYEISFGLAPRNEELSPQDPETPEPFTLRSGNGTRNGEQVQAPHKILRLYQTSFECKLEEIPSHRQQKHFRKSELTKPETTSIEKNDALEIGRRNI